MVQGALGDIQIPCYFKGGTGLEEIYTFCDAIQHAYATSSFLKSGNEGEVSIMPLQSKASRLTKAVKEALKMDSTTTHYWTDSTTSLTWIPRNNEWETLLGIA